MESWDSWDVSVKLQRFLWLLHAHNVEVKARRLAWAIRTNFNPNQPRVPRGNPDGGQWTNGGGGGVQVAQNIPPEEEFRRDFEDESFASEARLEVVNAQAKARLRQVQEVDPNWKPSPRISRLNSIESQITAAERERAEAEARLRELAQASPQELIDAYRQRDRDLFGDELLSHGNNTVAVCKTGDAPYFGVNSKAPGSLYTPRDQTRATGVRTDIIADNPELVTSGHVGRMPLNALFHAETTSLLRAAADAKGGTLEGQEIEVHVDGEICNHCDTILPEVVKRIGNPTVRFTDTNGYHGTVRKGEWTSENAR